MTGLEQTSGTCGLHPGCGGLVAVDPEVTFLEDDAAGYILALKQTDFSVPQSQPMRGRLDHRCSFVVDVGVLSLWR